MLQAVEGSCAQHGDAVQGGRVHAVFHSELSIGFADSSSAMVRRPEAEPVSAASTLTAKASETSGPPSIDSTKSRTIPNAGNAATSSRGRTARQSTRTWPLQGSVVIAV